MTAGIKKVRKEDKEKYLVFLKRSKELYEMAGIANETQRWGALGVNAVGAAISMGDALTVYYLLQRSIADDHRFSADLLSEIVLDDIKEQVSNYRRIIAKKYAVSYENRDFRQKEALEVLKQVERFYNWGLGKLSEDKEGL